MNSIELTEAYGVAASQLEAHLRRTTFKSEMSSITGSGGGMTASIPEIVEVVILAALPSIRERLALEVEALRYADANQWIPDTMWGIKQAAEAIRGTDERD